MQVSVPSMKRLAAASFPSREAVTNSPWPAVIQAYMTSQEAVGLVTRPATWAWKDRKRSNNSALGLLRSIDSIARFRRPQLTQERKLFLSAFRQAPGPAVKST